jgi:hypothetical protein
MRPRTPALWLVLWLCGWLGAFPTSSRAQIAVRDLTPLETSRVDVTFRLLKFDVRAHEIKLQATITNRTTEPIAGPLYLAIDEINPSAATLRNPDHHSVEGIPLYTFTTTTLAPGASVTTTLVFAHPTHVQLRLKHRLLHHHKQPPLLTITSPAPDSIGRVTPLVVTGTVRDQAIVVTVNNLPAVVRQRTWSATVPVREGPNLLTAVATDRAGHTDQASLTVTLDTTPPVLTATLDPPPNAAGWHATDVTVRFDATDALSGVASVTPPVTVTTQGAGQVVSGTATDRAGNSRTLDVTVNLDKTPPGVAITSPPPDSVGRVTPLTVSGTVTESTATVRVHGLAATVSGQTWTATVPLQEGLNTLAAVATDLAGHSGQASLSVTLDTTPPTLTATLEPPPNAAGWQTTDTTVRFSATDALSGVASVTPPVAMTTEGAGQVVNGVATDQAGNSRTLAVTVNLDKTPPTLAITTPADGITLITETVTVSGQVSDAVSGVAGVTCNGQAAARTGPLFTCTLPLTIGSNPLTVRVTDVAGLQTTASRTVVRTPPDTTPPTLAITAPADGSLVLQNPPTITVSYSDLSGINPASLAFTANGAPLPVTCTLGPTGGTCTPTTPLPERNVTLQATLADTVGNVATAQVTFTLDSLPVTVQIITPTDRALTRAPDVTVTGTVSPDVVAVTVNTLPATLTGGQFTVTVPLREGTNMVVAVGANASGKTGTHAVEITRDLTAPIVRIDTPRASATLTSPTVTVTGQVNDLVNGGAEPHVTVNGRPATVTQGTFVAPNLPLVTGANTLEAVATDAAGNTGRHAIAVTVQTPTGPRLTLHAGDGQAGPVMQPLPQPLVVRVTDAQGNPLAGQVVRFAVVRNNGTLQSTPAETPQRVIQVPTDGHGQATVLLTLGDTAGGGNNRVLATALGVAGEALFCASGQPEGPAQILVSSGDKQRGTVDNPLAAPLEALVEDRLGNPIGDVAVTFTVVQGQGDFGGQASLVRTTDTNGLARAVFTLGLTPGINANVVRAAFAGMTQSPALFTATGLTPGNPAQTRFSGVVLDNAYTPIPRAVVTIPGTTLSTVTDAQGQFLLTQVPVGAIHLHIDPSASPRSETFPPLAFETVTVAGQENTLGQPILIPALALDAESAQVVGGPQDVTLKMAGVPGLELTVFAHSVTCPDGSTQCPVSISQVHLDKVPMPPPGGRTFLPPAWTVQQAGTAFNPPARISIPNNGLLPGSVVDVFQFDHALNMFVNIGKGTVSEDGQKITTDPGFGITHAGWGGGGAPAPPPIGCCCGNCPACTKCSDTCANGAGCVADDQQLLPQVTGNCQSEVCISGKPSFTPDNNDTPAQKSPHDCRTDICDLGSVVSVPNDSEVPASQCQICQGGTPRPKPDGLTPTTEGCVVCQGGTEEVCQECQGAQIANKPERTPIPGQVCQECRQGQPSAKPEGLSLGNCTVCRGGVPQSLVTSNACQSCENDGVVNKPNGTTPTDSGCVVCDGGAVAACQACQGTVAVPKPDGINPEANPWDGGCTVCKSGALEVCKTCSADGTQIINRPDGTSALGQPCQMCLGGTPGPKPDGIVQTPYGCVVCKSGVGQPVQITHVTALINGKEVADIVPFQQQSIPVSFTSIIEGNNCDFEYHWDFGDGYTSIEQNPLHIFASPGQYRITFRLTCKGCNIQIPSEELQLIVFAGNMTAFRPQTVPFQRRAVPENEEETPGVGIRVNGDDNDSNLIEVQIKIVKELKDQGVEYVLRRSNTKIKVWEDQKKEKVILEGNNESTVFADTDTDEKTVWVESVEAGSTWLELAMRSAFDESLIMTDRIYFFSFLSTLIILGGEFQTPSDPPESEHGVFQIATDLYRMGYDVHMYPIDKEIVDTDGAGGAYDEIVSTIKKRGVKKIAIIGYSHGGGGTHDLSTHLDNSRDSIGNFDISYTAYIDAIVHSYDSSTTEAENRRPPGSLFHLNYYQKRGSDSCKAGLLEITGGAMDVKQADDIQVNVTQNGLLDDSGKLLDHCTIDNDRRVQHAIINGLTSWLAR